MISYCGHSPNLYTNQDIFKMSYLFTKEAYWNLEDNVCCCDDNGHSICLEKHTLVCSYGQHIRHINLYLLLHPTSCVVHNGLAINLRPTIHIV